MSVCLRVLAATLCVALASCGPHNPCSTHSVVQTQFGAYVKSSVAEESAFGKTRILRYELDDGHVYDRRAVEWVPSTYESSNAPAPITSHLALPGTSVQLCEEKSQLDGKRHYSLAMKGEGGTTDQAVVEREP